MKIKTINNIQIHKKSKPTWSGQLFECRVSAGPGYVVLEEFLHLDDAEKWCRKTWDFVRRRQVKPE